MHGFWLDMLIGSKAREDCSMQVNVDIDMATDLKMCGMTMKKHEFVAEEQGAQEPEPKRKHETKVINKKDRNREDNLSIEL